MEVQKVRERVREGGVKGGTGEGRQRPPIQPGAAGGSRLFVDYRQFTVS